jgi:hypothetical protein
VDYSRWSNEDESGAGCATFEAGGSHSSELKEIPGSSPFVFPGRNGDKPISNNTMLFALYRLGYKGKTTGHGFRAVAPTILNEAGFNPDVIERQLAHCERNEIRVPPLNICPSVSA